MSGAVDAPYKCNHSVNIGYFLLKEVYLLLTSELLATFRASVKLT